MVFEWSELKTITNHSPKIHLFSHLYSLHVLHLYTKFHVNPTTVGSEEHLAETFSPIRNSATKTTVYFYFE